MSHHRHSPASSSSSDRQVVATSEAQTHSPRPTPALSRPPSIAPTTPESSHPSLRNLTDSARTPRRTPPSAPVRTSAHLRSPPSTLYRAANTALPGSPAIPNVSYASPPSSFPARLQHPVELHPLTPRRSHTRAVSESPFDDRHSILVEEQTGGLDEDLHDFSYEAGAKRQKTMPGYQFAATSPTSWDGSGEKKGSGGELGVHRPISELRRSLYPTQPTIPAITLEQHPDLTPSPPLPTSRPPVSRVQPIKPSFRGLFALSTTRDILIHLLPAVTVSCLASLVQPYMSQIIGNAFQAFVAYPIDNSLATAADRKALTDGIRDTTIKLSVAGGAAIVLNYAKGVLWQRHGEKITARLRDTVYEGIQGKTMEWFDLGMGMREEENDKSETVGAGGLMAKFTRETDDVRLATSQAFGNATQYFCTFFSCFILGMVRSPILSLITLSTIPVVILVQIITQVLCAPLYSSERRAFAEASTNIERATSAISTVKAHNAQRSEVDRFTTVANRARDQLAKQSMVWGVSIGATDFFLLGTFVIGFWYGAKVVRDGSVTAGTVMTVFWACLLAATYLQMVVPQLTVMTKGKNSMASLMTIIQDEPTRPTSAKNYFSSGSSPQRPAFPINHNSLLKSKPRPLSLQGIRPSRCRGEFNLCNVSFAYPSRPANPVLVDVSLFIPPGETTFIVGGSGSGKSTVAQLLLRLYAPSGGEITLDDQSFPYLDEMYTRQHIAAVQQGCILFDMSLHENVAMGLAGAGADPKTGLLKGPKDVTRAQVIEACRMAMIHDFIESLPQGYETRLGTGGSALSGGQRQRLAIARARIRDPTVLILDEATSALDATSRVVVFRALKAWRQNRTTIVITHDLSQIDPDDFVYVMQDGVVAEQGFRSDLSKKTPLFGQPRGIFAAMAAEQAIDPLPPKMEEWRDRPHDEEILEGDEEIAVPDSQGVLRAHTPRLGVVARPGSAIYLDLLDEYSRGGRFSTLDALSMDPRKLNSAQKRLSWTPAQLDRRQSRSSAIGGYRESLVLGSRSSLVPSRPVSRMSRQPSHDASPNLSLNRESFEVLDQPITAPAIIEKEAKSKYMLGYAYQQRTLSQNLDDDMKGDLEIVTHPTSTEQQGGKLRGIFSLMFHLIPTVPRKWFLVIGVLGSIGHGVVTPVWSFFLSKLMTIVGAGGSDPSLVKYSLVVLALCGLQAITDFVQEYFLYSLAALWTARIRSAAFDKVLAQDKAWFDETTNAPSSLVQSLIKDADDMRLLIGSVIGQFSTFIAMVGLGIIWAMVVQWRLTLIGVAIAPAFAIMVIINNYFIGRAETINKAKREAVAKTFYESISNIRGIRAMALEGTFREHFRTDASAAKRTGDNAGWSVALGVGAIAGMPLLAQALMNWAGCQFMLQGYINYEQMLQVYNLVLFSLTFGTAMLAFIPSLSKARVAARDFDRLFTLSTSTPESSGELRFPISGHVSFSHISFAYPSRPDVPIFTDLSFTFAPGECVAIVGPSGSGKSTIAALLQRLYEPASGSIIMDKYDLCRSDVKWLRNHIAVVSQSANLFDASVAQNIAYGSEVPIGEIHRAAKAANIHDFIQTLPEGYDTNLGENASLISGGQAQRLQIARALVRRSNILILDECTSALDPDNQKAILDTIIKIKDTRTTVFITHSVEAMKRCDRVICLGEGKVAEDGSFEELVSRGGVFARLMKTGEWE